LNDVLDEFESALESYDIIGGWRDFYRSQGKGEPVIDPETKKHRGYRKGPLVDPSGELADGRKFASIEGLKVVLLTEKEAVARTLVNNLVTYATGAGITLLIERRLRRFCGTRSPNRTASELWSMKSSRARSFKPNDRRFLHHLVSRADFAIGNG
jgi:hypothetical protein